MLPEIEKHVQEFIERTNWPDIKTEIGDPCVGCPGFKWDTTHPEERDQPPCFQCPLWSLRVDLALLDLRRKMGLGRLPK